LNIKIKNSIDEELEKKIRILNITQNSILLKENIKEDNLLSQIIFKNNKYKDTLRPNIFFYRYLSIVSDYQIYNKEKLNLIIPDTIIYDGLSSPFWIYNINNKYISRNDNFSSNQILRILGSKNKKEVVAIAKTVIFLYIFIIA